MGVKSISKLLGNKGEDLACEYLVKNGYKILGRNYRISFGEIDIICQRRKSFWDFLKLNNYLINLEHAIHFIEVKTLRSPTPQIFPEQRVDQKKQNKYKKLIGCWLEKNKYPQNYPCQMDIIAVSGDKIDFFENILIN